MARSLSFGNGSMLVCIDQFAQVRDLYFPYVGLENHIGGSYVHKIGVWADGQFSWVSDGSWMIRIDSDTANTGISVLYSSRLSVELSFTDVLYNEKNVLVHKVKVQNKSDHDREVRVFFFGANAPFFFVSGFFIVAFFLMLLVTVCV